MLIVWDYFKTKMKKIGPLERMLHWVKIDKLKKITLYIFLVGQQVHGFQIINLFFQISK